MSTEDPRFNYTERKKQEGDAFQKEFRSQKEQAVTPSPDQRAFTSDSETPTLEQLKWTEDSIAIVGLPYAKQIAASQNATIDAAAVMVQKLEQEIELLKREIANPRD
jgi:hypothetical protein